MKRPTDTEGDVQYEVIGVQRRGECTEQEQQARRRRFEPRARVTDDHQNRGGDERADAGGEQHLDQNANSPVRAESTRTYGQYCGLAKALDVIGDRWALLIVRELLLQGPCRYTDVRNGLPGIATNLLADRVRALEQSGIIERVAAPPPIATMLFRLTPRGEELRPVLFAIGRWGSALLREHNPDDSFCSHWITMPLELLLKDHAPTQPPVRIEVRTGEQPLVIETIDGAIRARMGRADRPDAVLTGSAQVVIAVLTGRLTLADACKRGLQYQGTAKTLRRIQPAA